MTLDLTQKDIDDFLYVSSSSALEVLDGFDHDKRIMGLTLGKFSLIDLIKAVLDIIGPSSVKVVTWSAGVKDAKKVAWLKDSKLITDFTIITDHSYVTRQVCSYFNRIIWI